MNIKFYTKSVYGKETAYAAEERDAKAIQKISGQKTLTPNVIKGLKELGFSFEHVFAPVSQSGLACSNMMELDRILA